MKSLKRNPAAAFICVFFVLVLTACSAKKEGHVFIYSDTYAQEYQEAALNHFSNVGWAAMDFLDSPVEDRELQQTVGDYSVTHTISIGMSDDTRYVVVISEDEDILTRDALEGKRYSVYVFNNGSGDIEISVQYHVGTTDNCVVKGNVVDGEIAANRTMTVSASGISDPGERAGLIFDALYEALLEIEGK